MFDGSQLPVRLESIFGAMLDLYDAVCLIDLPKDTLFQVKYPVGDIPFLMNRSLRYSEAVEGVVRFVIHAQYQSKVIRFLQPDAIRTALIDPGSIAEISFASKNNHWKRITIKPVAFENDQVTQVLYLMTDYTVTQMQYEHVLRESEHDPLTLLYNRTKLKHMLESEYTELTSCAVAFFDVDGLKQINDMHGHATGDSLIVTVADSLRPLASSNVHIYRYGGDEFLVIACNCSRNYLAALLKRWKAEIGELMQASSLLLSVSVGTAYSEAPCDVLQLIKAADEEMYLHKPGQRGLAPHSIHTRLL